MRLNTDSQWKFLKSLMLLFVHAYVFYFIVTSVFRGGAVMHDTYTVFHELFILI